MRGFPLNISKIYPKPLQNKGLSCILYELALEARL